MKILLQNTINGLLPVYPSDYDEKESVDEDSFKGKPVEEDN